MKKLLYVRDSECIQPLRALVEKQTHLTLALWALDCAPETLHLYEYFYPADRRPREALETAMAWARGEVKMPVAKKAIHAAHNAASEAEENPVAQAAARAVGHAAATVHVETHALGLVFYGLTAIAYDTEPESRELIVDKKLGWFYDKLLDWEANEEGKAGPWAAFLTKDKPNKERLLREGMESSL